MSVFIVHFGEVLLIFFMGQNSQPVRSPPCTREICLELTDSAVTIWLRPRNPGLCSGRPNPVGDNLEQQRYTD